MLKYEGDQAKVGRANELKKFGRLFVKSIPTLIVLGVLGLGWLAVHEINTVSPRDETRDTSIEAAGETGVLQLPDEMRELGAFHCLPVELQSVQHRHAVPGRIQYDESRHIEVETPVEGVLADLLVKPGDTVQPGQLLAAIKSPEMGQARSEVLRRRQMLHIVQQKLNRERELSKNLYEFFDQLDQGKAAAEIEEVFANRPLGNFRQELLLVYTQKMLAQSLIDKGKGLGETGAISGRMIRERESELAIASATFRALRDQTSFASKQSRLQAEADVEEAQRQSNIAQQTLEALLGYAEQVDNVESTEALSRLEIRAPFAGSIESRLRSQNERIAKGEALLVLADTDSLYVAADIRETDWSAVTVKAGTLLMVTVPALENKQLPALVHYVGREVTTDTNSIPIVATIDNTQGWLRPGMFVRVSIPIGEPRSVLAVKPASIVQHANKKFVFVEMEDGRFKRIDIQTGLTSNEWVEVVDGLSSGQRVVDQGAFLLKSELLLESEAE